MKRARIFFGLLILSALALLPGCLEFTGESKADDDYAPGLPAAAPTPIPFAVVTSVSATSSDSTYQPGDSISITVTFSRAVNVTGVPQLTLETGTSDAVADYVSGTGSRTLTFGYTVALGDVNGDLDYASVGALSLNGGTILDDEERSAVLALPSPGASGSLGANKGLIIDGILPAVTSVTASSANGTYGIGQVIGVQVVFNKVVNVSGVPQLTLETGGTDAVVDYTTGTGTTTLLFNYTIASGDTSSDLDYAATTSLALNGGTIRDGFLNDATLTLAAPGAAGSLGANKAIGLDTVVPTVANVTSAAADGTFGLGQSIAVQVVFTEAVTVTGTPQLTLETGGTDAVVNYTSGTGTTTLVFTYTVAAGHVASDLDYAATTSLALNGGTIKDAGNNAATLTLAAPGAAGSLGANKDFAVDTVAPTVTGVTSQKADGSYGAGQVINVQVVFDKAVTVTGTPQLTLETGTTDAVVNYTSGTGTPTLVFAYTVAAGHTTSDLDYKATTSLALGGGTIKDAFNNPADLTLAAPGAAGSLGANKSLVIDAIAPTVSGLSSVTTNGTYAVGQVISIQITFTKAVTVTGTPQLTLETGATDAVVNYLSGSGTTSLTFDYTISAGDSSSDLNTTATTSLALNGGTIQDSLGNNATLTLPSPGGAGSLGANKNLAVDAVRPTVSAVSSSTGNGTYSLGAVIPVEITFTKPVVVMGVPQITLETGGTDAVVSYTSGSGSATLVFNYTVAAGHVTTDLDYVATTSLSLNGGTIKDVLNNLATLTLPAPAAAGSLGANKAIVIDTVSPVVVDVTSSKPDGSYGEGTVIPVQVVFDRIVNVTNTPQLTLEFGATDVAVNYTTGTGTTTLTFNYTVAANQNSADLDYSATTSLALNGGTIKDGSNVNAILTLPQPASPHSLGGNKSLVVDTARPFVVGVSSTTPDGLYTIGDVISVEVTFSRAVDVRGTPQLTLETGGTDAVLDYSSGSGSTKLVFNYTVASGQNSSDLDYVATTSLALNGGTIKDPLDNAATLTLAAPAAAGSLGANKNLVIDTVSPIVTDVTSLAANGPHGTGEVLGIQLIFDRAITVTGTPQLTLETGATDAVVNYTSGTGTNVLVFNYTVATGHASVDLDYASRTSLALNGGALKDGGMINALLILPTPGMPRSLSSNKDLVLDTVGPTVVSVTSSALDDVYPAGSVIPITVDFSEAVDVTGTPQLTLETGATDAVVDYASGSGTATLTFNYTVAAGQNSADLDYVGTTSLALNGGTVADLIGNAATLTLPAPAAAGSLGANKNLKVETDHPVVTLVTSSAANGSYGVGQLIPIRIYFDRAVTVTNTPRLTLETGTTDAVVNYTSGSGTNVLVFNYTVASGENASTLEHAGAASLALNGGTIKDGAVDAILTLPLVETGRSLSANKLITVDTAGPTVASLDSHTPDGVYGQGDGIAIDVTFSEIVNVTGTPTLTLETGASDGVASYASGSGTNILTFNYFVGAGENSSDLDATGTTALALSGGSIQDAQANNAVLTLPTPGGAGSLGANRALTIDTVHPIVSSVSSSATNGSFGAGSVIPIQVNFNRIVNVVGVPQLQLLTGLTASTVNYTTGTGTSTLVFNYTVAPGHFSSDLDYPDTTALLLNGATIRDGSLNDAVLSLPIPATAASLSGNKDIVIDTTTPTVTNVTAQTLNGVYGTGEEITIEVAFSKSVDIVGVPQLTLETGVTDGVASYLSGSGSTNILFKYTVGAGHGSPDLDYASTTALALNGGTIEDSGGNGADLTLPPPATAGSLGFNSGIVIDTTNPLVVSVDSSTADGTYTTGDGIDVQVIFNRAVNVTSSPQLTLETGSTDTAVDYTSGSGTTTLVFHYDVAQGDESTDLNYISASALSLNGGAIKDGGTLDAVLTLPLPESPRSLAGTRALVVDTSNAYVTNVTSVSDDGLYPAGQTIPIEVTFSKAVTVTGTPQLTLETGGTDAVVDYVSGSGTSSLIFAYTVGAGENSTDLDYVATTSLSLNGGAMKDDLDRDAVLSLPLPGGEGSLGANKNFVIDTTNPVVSHVTSAKADGTYGPGEVIGIEVVFSQNVTVTGTPRLTLETGNTNAVVNYTSGTGTNTLLFNYTVAQGHASSDLDYVAVNSLSLNGGTIQGGGALDAQLSLPTPAGARSLAGNKAFVIDTQGPRVSSVTSAVANGLYGVGEVIGVQIQFDEPVMVTGTPRLTLETGTSDAVVNYSSGDGTTTLTFNYTVAAGHKNPDLNYLATSALALNGGALKDAVGNDATLTLPALDALESLAGGADLYVDTISPRVTGVSSSTADGVYFTGETISIQVTYNQTVDVLGTPLLNLETGAVHGTAAYTSGTGTATLTFTYTVADGETNLDLDYSSATPINLDGGTIRNGSGDDALVFFPAPGAAGSLSDSKELAVSPPSPTLVTANPGTEDGAKLGSVVASAGDVDGDGTDDIIVGEPFANATGTDRGAAYVLSGADGSLLHLVLGTEDGARLGAAVAGVGDIDGDGKSEFIVGEPYFSAGGTARGRARVFNGDTGAVMFPVNGSTDNYHLGAAVAGGGDADGDGVPDFHIGEPDSSAAGAGRGEVWVYSGADGSLIWALPGAADGDGLGFSVAGAGDVDGDTQDDFIVGAPTSAQGGTNRGMVRVYSGATGLVLRQFVGTVDHQNLGYSVAGGRDADGDTTNDVLIGAPYQTGGTAAGSAYVYSGADGSLLLSLGGKQNGNHFGACVAFVADVSLDGKAEVFVGEPGDSGSKGKAHVINGATGSRLLVVYGTETGAELGASVASTDLNGDGKGDFIVGLPLADGAGTDRGKVNVYTAP